MSRVAVPSIEADLANYAAVTHQAMRVYLPDTRAASIPLGPRR